MIIKGSNNPLIIQFDTAVDDLPTLVVTLWNEKDCRTPMKMWTLSDMTVDYDTVACQITEEETKAMPSYPVVLEAKGLDENGDTVFWDAIKINVKDRYDKVIQLTGV